MFCSNCGAEIQTTTKFCPKCGASQKAAPAPAVGHAASAPEAMPASAKGKVVYGINTIVGCAGAGLAFISLFFAWFTDHWSSANFYAVIRAMLGNNEGGTAGFMIILVFLGIGLIALFQLIKFPKLSLVGILLLLLNMAIWLSAKSQSEGSVTLGFGFWLYVVGIAVCTVGAFLPKKRA